MTPPPSPSVVLTRPEPAEGCPLAARLKASGWRVVHVPLVQIIPVRFEWPEGTWDWVFFTSRNAVQALRPQHWEHLALSRIAVVGPATAEAVRHACGRPPDFIPRHYDGESAAREFSATGHTDGANILWPRGDRAHPALGELLTQHGGRVTPLIVYQTHPRMGLNDTERRMLSTDADVLVFTSPSAVETFQALGLPLGSAKVACIGPRTAEAARQTLGRVDILPEEHTLEALGDRLLAKPVP